MGFNNSEETGQHKSPGFQRYIFLLRGPSPEQTKQIPKAHHFPKLSPTSQNTDWWLTADTYQIHQELSLWRELR